MIYAIKRLIKSGICVGLIFYSVGVSAQVNLVQQTIDKVESYKNFSYQSISKLKELFTSDTIIERHNSVFAKTPEDKNFGYLFNIETLNENDKSAYTDLYNGQNLIHTIHGDSIYEIRKAQAFNIQPTLIGCLKWLQGRLEKGASKIVKNSDTTINAIDSYHLIVNVYDTIINKEHNYTNVHLYINKLSGIPDCIITQSRNTTYGDGISNYYSESRYFDYKINQDNIDIASMTIPKGFHPPKEQHQTSLLALGNVAPDWSLYAADGKKMSLTEMKGKVVLLDFYFIGCFPCMQAIAPLKKLYEKYKNQNVVIASITERDSKKSVGEFEKNYHVKYPGYINGAEVVKSYHVNAFPTFYFIDKDGKIANVIVGYSDDLEEKMTSVINNLLNK